MMRNFVLYHLVFFVPLFYVSCIFCTIVLCVVFKTKIVIFDMYYRKEVGTLKLFLRIHSETQGITLIKQVKR